MRLTLFCLTSILALQCAAVSAAPSVDTDSLRLLLSAPVPMGHVGDKIKCVLSLEGSEVLDIVSKTADIVSVPPSNAALSPGGMVFNAFTNPDRVFRYQFEVQPQQAGDVVLGSYKMQFNGKPVSSNEVTIHVIPKSDPEKKVSIALSRKNIKLGESVILMLDQWRETKGKATSKQAGEMMTLKQAALLTTKPFQTIFSGGANSVSFEKDQTTYGYFSTYILTPVRAGRFVFTKADFKDLPDGAEIPKTVLEVQ